MLRPLSRSPSRWRGSRAACPRDCMGRGLCTGGGVCICNETFSALPRAAARAAQLSAAATAHAAWTAAPATLAMAATTARPSAPFPAQLRAATARCSQGSCACDPGRRTRLLGGTRERLPGELQRAWRCSLGRCECDPGFGGAACDKSVPSPGCPAACSGRGSCHAGACLCLRGFGGAGCELATAQPACPSNVRGAARVSTACAVPPAMDRALVRPLPLEAECTSPGLRVCVLGPRHLPRERSHRAAHVLVRARFRGAACDVALRWCPSDCSGRGECRALALRGAPADSPLPGLAQLLRAMHAGRDERAAAAAAVDSLQVLTTAQLEAVAASAAPASLPTPRGVCVCRAGSAGPACADGVSPADSCPNGCSGRGFCRAAGCVCEAGFGGADCGIACSPERWSGCAWV